MHECTSIIINSFHFFQRTLLNKRFVVEGGGGGSLKSEWKQTEEGEWLSLSMLTLWKKLPGFLNSK